jgi:Fic family protein
MPPPELPMLEELATRDRARLMRIMEWPGDPNAPYLPWDQLRYRTPPVGLTTEDWWFATKFRRMSGRRELPLSGVDGRPFNFCLPDELLRMCDEISRRAGGQIAMGEQVTNPATRDRYLVSSLMEEAITSSQLEGASTTRRVAKEMIRRGRPPTDRSERMILNNYFAMRHVVEIAQQDLTPELICEVHRIVTEATLDDPEQAGRLEQDQSARVRIFGDRDQVLHIPPPVSELPGRLAQLCRFANGELDHPWMPPVLRALTVHFMTGYDHYFADGNGRTARSLFYWSMLREQYWLTEFFTISRILRAAPSQYARSFLLTEQDDGDLTYFFVYHLKVIIRAIDDLEAYLERKVRELRGVRKVLAATPNEYNHRQVALLELALRDSTAVFTVQSHATSHNVTGETARTDLADLELRGLLGRTRVGRRYAWHPVPDLGDVVRRQARSNSK